MDTPQIDKNTPKISYSSDQLRLLRPANTCIPRNVRKSIFKCGIWKPKSTDIESCQINKEHHASTKNKRTVDHQVLRSLPKVTPNYQRNILKFAMVNAQSLRNKVEDFTHSVISSSYDVCLVSETWLRKNDMGDEALIAQLKINGFDFLHSPRGGNDNRGGGFGYLI